MKKFVTIGLLSSSLIMGCNSVKADTWDHWAIKTSDALSSTGLEFYTVNSATGEATLRTTKCFPQSGINPCKQQIGTNTYVDPETGKFFFENGDGETHSYNLDTDTWTNEGTSWKATYTNSSGSVYQRLSVKRKSNGEIHIGDNSWITKEENGKQSVYAKDANGNPIPINYINGTDLQINGKSVQGQIDTNASNIKNLGEGVAGSTALTAALSALPQTSKESKLSCGVGTGVYSSRYALGFGCASKVNERVDINGGGSYVFGGSKSYGKGTLDSGVIKAGFVFKFGELNKPTLISINDKEKMEDKIFSLEEKNEKIISQNEELKNKNQSIISQNKSLLARLERLEKIALSEINSRDLATIKLP